MRFARWVACGLGLAVVVRPGPLRAEITRLPTVVVRARRIGPRPGSPGRRVADPEATGHRQARLDHDRIQASGAPDLASLLQGQAGFAVRRYGARGQLATATLRGVAGEGILVLQDGVRLNSPLGGGTDLGAVSLLGVDHVDVLAGAGSGRYGPGAVGGVVQLVTRTSGPSRVAVSAGSWGERDATIEASGGAGSGSVVVAASRSHADDDFAYVYRGVTAIRRNAAFDAAEASVASKAAWGAEAVRVVLRAGQQDEGVPGPVNQPSPRAHERDGFARVTLAWDHALEGGRHLESSVGTSHGSTGYTDPDSPYAKATDTGFDTLDLASTLTWQAGPDDVALGVCGRDEGASGGVAGRRRTLSGTWHETWRPDGRWRVSGDVRVDDVAPGDWHVSPGLGLGFTVVPGVALRAAADEAWRLPGFEDLYWPATPDTAGNPALRPETTRAWELGADLDPAPGLQLQGTLFRQLAHDLIVWAPDAGGRWSPSNVGSVGIDGAEALAAYRAGAAWYFEASATWTQARDLAATGPTAGKLLPYRPDLGAHLGIEAHPTAAWTLGLTEDVLGQRFTTAQDTDALPPFAVTGLRVAWSPTARDTFTLRCANLLDATYELEPYYPLPGRSVTATFDHLY